MYIRPMNSEDLRFQLFDVIDEREVTADDCANPVSSNSGLAIPVAIEKIWDCQGLG